MMCKSWIGLGFACAVWSGMMAEAAAQNRMTTGSITWTVDSAGTLSTRQWPVESLMKLRMESPKERVMGNDPFKQAPASPPELKFESDRSVSMIGVLEGAGGSKVTLTTQRSVVFDAQRRAVRLLDVVSSSEDSDREIAISYQSQWRQEPGLQVATPREFFVGKSAASCGALAAVIGDPEAPILMILFGGQERGWKRTVEASPTGLRWTYSGLLGAKQRVVLMHWIALADDAKTETLKQVRETLLDAKGMPLQARVDDQVLKELVNFPMPEEKPVKAEPVELPLVKQLADSFKVGREFSTDHLTMSGVPLLKGDFSATAIRLASEAGERDLPLEEIAAIQGGAAVGRRARVFLRDGSVLSGAVQWQDGQIEKTSLGTVRVTPEALDTLILRRDEDRDGHADFAALVMTQSGDVRGLEKVPEGAARIRWAGGELQLKWQDIESLQQLPLPDLGQEARLRDGSRIRGWFGSDDPAVVDCVVFARTWEGLQQAADPANTGPPPSPQPAGALHLRTTQDSLVFGSWGQPSVAVSGAAGLIEVPVAEIRQLLIKATEGAGDQMQIAITTATGGIIQGAAVSSAVQWKRDDQVLTLPWGSVAEIADNPAAPTQP